MNMVGGDRTTLRPVQKSDGGAEYSTVRSLSHANRRSTCTETPPVMIANGVNRLSATSLAESPGFETQVEVSVLATVDRPEHAEGAK